MLRLSRTVWIQLAILAAVTVIAVGVMAFGFVNVPALLGIGRYTVTVELPASGGLYPTSVVTYRGTEIGRVKSIDVTRDGVRAVLNAQLGHQDPVRRVGRGAQPVGRRRTVRRTDPGRGRGNAPPLRDGDVIPVGKAQVPRRHRKPARRHQQSAAGDPAGQSAHRRRRSGQGRRRAGTGTVPHRRRVDVVGDRGGQDRRPDHAVDRPVTAGAEFPSADVGFDRDLGAAHGRRSPVSSRRRTRPSRICSTRAGLRWTKAERCSTGSRPRLPVLLANLVSLGEIAVTYRARHRAAAGALPAGHGRHVGDRARELRYQAGLQGHLPRLQPQPQPAAAVQHRIPAGAAAAVAVSDQDCSRAARRRAVLPGAAGLGPQCPWRAQHSVRDQPGQAGADGRAVRERRAVRPAQRRLQLEGRPQRDAVRSGRSAVSAGPSAAAAADRRRRPAVAPVASCPTTRRPATTSARTASATPRPTSRTRRTRPGSRCWCRPRRRPSAPSSSRARSSRSRRSGGG